MQPSTQQRRRLLAGLTALTATTCSLVAVHHTPVAAYDPDRGLRCAADLCLITVGDEWVDSDGDGTSDADEKAAGVAPDQDVAHSTVVSRPTRCRGTRSINGAGSAR